MANPLYGQNVTDTAIDRARNAYEGHLDGEIITAAKTLTVGELNRTYILNNAAAFAVTLPSVAASDSGRWVKFVVMTTITSVGSTIVAASGDLLEGYCFITKGTDAVANMAYFDADESNDLTITQNGSTTGGLVGSTVFMQVNDNGYWTVEAMLYGSGTLATPFS